MQSLRVMAFVWMMSCLAFSQQSSPLAGAPVAVVPRLIRFSGQVKDASGTVGITFSLHKSPDDNAALWIETQSVAVDTNGRYTVLLGATKAEGIPTELFTSGEAQWLAVQVAGKPEQARILLVSVPYALKAAEAETLAGHAATEFVTTDKLSAAVKEQVQQTSTTPITKLKANAASSGATNFSGSTADQVVGVTQSGTGAALNATAPGIAIKGTSTATTGTVAGVRGTTASTAGFGVWGVAPQTTGAPSGVRGSTAAPNGFGVFGNNSAITGAANGVRGTSASAGGIGVLGNNTATTGNALGVKGVTASPAGVAMEASATSSTGTPTALLASVPNAGGTAAVLQIGASGKFISGQVGALHAETFFVTSNGDITADSLKSNLVSSGVVNATNASFSQPYQIQGYPVLGVGTKPTDNDIFVGPYAGYSNVAGSGTYNTFLGEAAGYWNTSGTANVFVGTAAGFNHTTGSENVAVGNDAGVDLTTGYSNTYLGYNAGGANKTGYSNIAIGNQAGVNSTGNSNIFLGDAAGYQNTTGSLNIYIGNPGCTSPCTESNTIRIGGNPGLNEQFATYMSGVYSSAIAGGVPMAVSSTGRIGYSSPSSIRFKEEIDEMGDASKKLFELRPVTFFYNQSVDDGSHQRQYGLIAEEVAKIYPELVAYDRDGKPLTVRYTELAPMLLNIAQKEHKTVLAQQKKLNAQQKQMNDLRKQMAELRAMIAHK